MRPMCSVARSPMFCHVFPASSDLEIPSPHEELCRLFGSPVPTHTTAGSDGAIAISPIVDTPSLSNTGSHVVPLFVVFHTPPDAVPTYTMFGLLSTTPKSSMRPPITAGPISRNSKFFSLSVTIDCDWPANPLGKVNASARQNILGAKIILNADNADEVRRILSPLVIKAGHHTSPMPRRASIVSGMANRPVLRQTRHTVPAFRSTAFYARTLLRATHLGPLLDSS